MNAASFGVVVIGRNEGERLVRCLQSLAGFRAPLVYVDSSSTDGSPDRARQLGALTVQLDLARPFTAARARNFGVGQLLSAHPALRYVQFVDGDCEVAAAWIPAALAFLEARPDVGVVCGRRRERHPEASVYNWLCDIEWNTPVGEAKACGGDAMMRVEALSRVGGFRDTLIAGEEPELCVRIRAAGWKVYRLDEEMTLHDAAMTRFSQWWKRSLRAGYAFAEGARLHGAPPERHWVKESRRAVVWGIALPIVIVVSAAFAWPYGLALMLIYPVQMLRLALRYSGTLGERMARGWFMVVGKFAEAAGWARFAIASLSGTSSRLIEYK